MARRGPNAQRHARSRAALLQAARTAFAREGFTSTRTGDIVKDTGLTRGALYHHFTDKLTLFDAVVEQVAKQVADRVDAAAQQEPTTLKALHRGCEEWFDAMTDPQLRRIYLIDGPAVLGWRRWREIDNLHGGGTLRTGVQAVLTERGDRDLDLEPLLALLSGALNEAAIWLAESDDQPTARRQLHTSLNALLNRLFPPPT
ncbi:TetR/AcrR family transcriptional regulator [Actinomadura soli]|uniref:TetR/AcrR family transcriptional regulator n=1 Tax=Actinomadura soli TaxID=2508997 RepID=UPI001486485D|nr:TetR/AcrR family transcriptional regulator [Actinomadura soli]